MTTSELFATVKKLHELSEDGPYSEVGRIRNLPASRSNVVTSFRISKSYGNMTNEETALAHRAFAEMRRIEWGTGVEERRKGLLQAADELEALRAILPQLAASVAIQAGERARQLRLEALVDPVFEEKGK
jgi:hypothetical protein